MIENYYKLGYQVLRPTAQNVGGLEKVTLQAVTSISGRMRPLSGNEIMQNEKQNYTTTHRFYCSVVGLKKDDIISKDGLQYEVKLIVNPMEFDNHLQVDCLLRHDLKAIDVIVISNEDLVIS